MKTAVVILNWNGKKMLQRFLPSVVEHTTGDAEVIVADNGSTDDSLAFLAEHYPTLRVIALDQNYGFAEGYNRALAEVDADYYVLLNDDVEVTPHWIEPVIAQMEQDKMIGICQPKLLMYDQRNTFEYAGAAGGFIDKYGYPFCRGRLFDTVEQDHHQYDDAREIFWASGAAMFVRASLWKKIGGLDADFFAHFEEIDFCWRAKHRGYRAEYCPLSTVYHVGGGTLPKSSPHKTYLNFRNNLCMLYKNLPDNRLAYILFARLILDGVAACKFLAEGKPKEFTAVLRAHRDYHRQHASLKKKRIANRPKHVPCIYDGLVLLEYYFQKHKIFTQLSQ